MKIGPGTYVRLKGDPDRTGVVRHVQLDHRGHPEALITILSTTLDTRSKVVPVADLTEVPYNPRGLE